MKPTHFFAASDVVVVGHEPEMADYDNPRGELYGFSTYVVAEDELGYRRRLHVETVSIRVGESQAMLGAERMAQALNVRLKTGKLPVAFDNWETVRPGYGSEAYIREGCEDDLIAWELQQDEVF